MHFTSDNALGASPKILEALIAANSGPSAAYGEDACSLRAAARLSEVFETECAVSLMATGTAANALALAALSPPWGAVFCHDDGHIQGAECGAPEFFTGGAKIVTIPGAAGKLTPSALNAALSRFHPGVPHYVQPAALSLSQATEAGTAYSPDEIAELTQVARKNRLGVHMDGARFANALVELSCTPAEMTWKAGVDILCFGATKNGALACEAVIFFDPAKAENFAYRRKRGGHTLSKGRLLGAQMNGYLEGGHWLDLARHANLCAERLARGLAGLPDVRLPWPRQANEVFPVLPQAKAARLRQAGAAFYDWQAADVPLAPGETFVRLVTSFATTLQEVETFVDLAAKA